MIYSQTYAITGNNNLRSTLYILPLTIYHLSIAHYNLSACITLIVMFYSKVKILLHYIAGARRDTDSVEVIGIIFVDLLF